MGKDTTLEMREALKVAAAEVANILYNRVNAPRQDLLRRECGFELMSAMRDMVATKRMTQNAYDALIEAMGWVVEAHSEVKPKGRKS